MLSFDYFLKIKHPGLKTNDPKFAKKILKIKKEFNEFITEKQCLYCGGYCKACGGSGETLNGKCSQCNGAGEIINNCNDCL